MEQAIVMIIITVLISIPLVGVLIKASVIRQLERESKKQLNK